jgi:hypothetical protein
VSWLTPVHRSRRTILKRLGRLMMTLNKCIASKSHHRVYRKQAFMRWNITELALCQRKSQAMWRRKFFPPSSDVICQILRLCWMCGANHSFNSFSFNSFNHFPRPVLHLTPSPNCHYRLWRWGKSQYSFTKWLKSLNWSPVQFINGWMWPQWPDGHILW